MMMAYDLQGNEVFCRNYNQGEFISVIQTDDGGFLAMGYTNSTVNVPNSPVDVYSNQRPSYIGSGDYLYYNPVSSTNMSHFNAEVHWDNILNEYVSDSYSKKGSRPFLVKTDANGDILWNFQYGGFNFKTNEDEAFGQKMLWGDIVKNGTGYLLVYSTQTHNTNISVQAHLKYKSFVISIDKDGFVLWKQQILSDGDLIESIAKHPTQNKYVLSGNRQYAAVLDANNTYQMFNQSVVVTEITPNSTGFTYNWNINGKNHLEYGAVLSTPTVSRLRSKSTDVDYKSNGDIVLPFIDNCEYCTGSKHNIGSGKVVVISSPNATPTTINIGLCNAYDFKIGVTPTNDGGFALVTSKGKYDATGNNLSVLDQTDPDLRSLFPDSWFTDDSRTNLVWWVGDQLHDWLKYWDTDTYIIKFNSSNIEEWDQTYDSHDEPRAAYPGDLKKQECVYAISQAQDGSFVVSGNSSHNFDDCMLLKTFSPCQQDLAFDTSADLIVNSNTTWSTNKIIGHNIIIDNNSTLTIDGATIEFGDYQQLGRMIGVHIKPGAKLKLINGAKLTSVQNCNDSKWLGINVYGNKSLSQTESNQGTIEIVGTASNPVVIENADDAISTRGFISYMTNNIDWNSFGGIIKATHCVFKNNLRDVAFWKYENKEGAINKPNISFFEYCTFTKDRPYANPTAYRAGMVSMWGVKGVRFTACTFDNDFIALEKQQNTNGIYSIDARFKVDWKCTAMNPTDGCTSADSSYFKGMYCGIRMLYTNWSLVGPYTVINGTEFKSINGVYDGGNSNNSFTRNSFYTPKNSSSAANQPAPYGLYLDYSSGYVVEENYFKGSGTGVYNAGVVVNNSGSLHNNIYKNTFDNEYMGIDAQDQNRNYTGKKGLELLCNNLSNGTYDITVQGDYSNSSHGIQLNQGSAINLASNTFSLSGGTYGDYYVEPGYINYHHHNPAYGSNPLNVKPQDYNGNIYLIGYDVTYNNCPSNINTGKTIGAYKEELAAAQQAVDNKQLTLEELLNTEDNWQLEADILFASQNSDWYNVYMDLMAQSPYLDHGIIESLILDSTFPDLMLRNIMLANPDAPKASHLMGLIYQRNMPAWMVADIENGTSSYGAKEKLEGEIAANIGIQHDAISSILGLYAASESYNGLDSIVDLLESRTEISYQYMLADAYIDNGQHNLVNTLVSGIPQLDDYSSQDAFDYADFQSWYNLRVSMAEQGLAWTDMNETQKATVLALASSGNDNLPMLWANTVLNLIDMPSYYSEEVRIPNVPSLKMDSSNDETVSPETLIKVYPNPASDLVQVYVGDILDGTALLYSLDGVLIVSQELKMGTAIFDVTTLASGTYIVKILSEEAVPRSIKIVVQH